MTEKDDNSASSIHVAIVGAYLIAFSCILVYSIIKFWPQSIAQNLNSSYSEVMYLSWKFSISKEIQILLLVATAGALGSMVHALRSFGWYVGMQEIKRSWLPSYILKPFSGAAIGLVFYLVFRGGFISTDATIQDPSPFGFVAISCIAGMFSEQAILKLKEVAETILSPAEKGKDHAEVGAPNLSISPTSPVKIEKAEGSTLSSIKIETTPKGEAVEWEVEPEEPGSLVQVKPYEFQYKRTREATGNVKLIFSLVKNPKVSEALEIEIK